MFTIKDYPSIVDASVEDYLINRLNHLAHMTELLECKRTFYVDTLVKCSTQGPSVYFYER